MSNEERSAAARYLGARGGRATAAKLTPEQRTANARKAGKARAAQRWGTPRRPPPKAGTTAARVLLVVQNMPALFGSSASTLDEIAALAELDRQSASNALSSLRSGGHVVSEPKPGSRREKLWRLA